MGLSLAVSSALLGNSTGSFIDQINNPNEDSKIENVTNQTENTENDIKTDNTQKTKNSSLKTTEQIVNEYFSDSPILIDVAKCESEFKQFSSNGTIHRGRVNPQDVGVMQINEKYHLSQSKKLGLDIYTLEGNLAYAKYLYKTQGTKPWNYSSKCWSKTREVALNN